MLEHLPPDFPVPVLVASHRPAVGAPGIWLFVGVSAVARDGQVFGARAQGTHVGDTLMRAAAEVYGAATCGVVFSGRLDDGSTGVRVIKGHGGCNIAQDPITAPYRSMPTSAIATGCVDLILPPRVLGPAIVALVMNPGASRFFSVPTPYWAQPVLAD